jgi:hypothetical protein
MHGVASLLWLEVHAFAPSTTFESLAYNSLTHMQLNEQVCKHERYCRLPWLYERKSAQYEAA